MPIATSGERAIRCASVPSNCWNSASPRLTSIDGVEIEAPLEGTLLVIHNEDRPGVIGEVGTILGRHAINIASFSLGRGPAGAIGVVKIEPRGDAESIGLALKELREVPALRQVCLAHLP